MTNLAFKAMKFAEKAHRGQIRKYSDCPYFIHPLRVMYRLRDHNYQDDDMMCAALLHDTIEDCGVTFEQLMNEFNIYVAKLVLELTQVDKLDPEIKKLPRVERHKLNVNKLKTVSQTAKSIKIADRLDNLFEVDLSNPECYGFMKRRYIQESWDILHAVEDLGSGDLAVTLWQRIKDLAQDCKVELK